MKKILISLCLYGSLVAGVLQAQNVYDTFIALNNAYSSNTTAFYCVQLLEEYSTDGTLLSETPAVSIISGNKEITRIEQRRQPLYFLSTPHGYWIKNSKLKSPLKIAGSYKIQEVHMQDLLRIDYENDFAMKEDESDNESIMLQRINKKVTYPYARLQYKDNRYVVEFLDSKKQKTKVLVYERMTVDGRDCFAKITITDTVFAPNVFYCFITTTIREIHVSDALFSHLYMDELIRVMDTR
ncbi:MAG: hypothetical protein IJ191_06795 [Treponema sp.]|nr:hypothetical protein [Treponema sp.]